jgi:hypothetical protein
MHSQFSREGGHNQQQLISKLNSDSYGFGLKPEGHGSQTQEVFQIRKKTPISSYNWGVGMNQSHSNNSGLQSRQDGDIRRKTLQNFNERSNKAIDL